MDVEKQLRNIYFGSGPGAWQGENRFFTVVQSKLPTVTRKQVHDFLSKLAVHQRYLEQGKQGRMKRHYPSRWIMVSGP